jgi:hypothetical protein
MAVRHYCFRNLMFIAFEWKVLGQIKQEALITLSSSLYLIVVFKLLDIYCNLLLISCVFDYRLNERSSSF